MHCEISSDTVSQSITVFISRTGP